MTAHAWETHHRWEWFRREDWRPTFRDWKRGESGGSCACFAETVGDLGGGPVLDCSCGFGLKTIVMKEMGLDVTGSDACAFAVEKARELAGIEGHSIDYFLSTWADLPRQTEQRFVAIFNDALSWTATREEFEASLRGFLGALRPGGVLVFMGAPEGSPSSPESRRKLLLDTFEREPKFRVEWSHTEGDVTCTALIVRELGDGFLDEHHLYMIDDACATRLEVATIRQPVTWDWPLLVALFDAAGFSKVETRTFARKANDGGDIALNIATK